MNRVGLWASLLVAACDAAPTPTADASATVDVATTIPTPVAEPGRHSVTITDTRQVIPGDGLPPETVPGNSNNNLDVVRHDGRVYLAWRTAPDHYASTMTRIFVVSSTDERAWRYEARFAMGTDLREPRFLSLNGRLFLYVSRLGTNSLSFDPQGVSVTERGADGAWSALDPVYQPGYLLWRARVERGTAYLFAYLHGENEYLFNGLPLDVEMLTTRDGRTWEPVDPARRVIYRGGASETDMALGDDGTLYGVMRNEAGDDTGFGSLVCRAPAGDLARWSCRHDPRKYDSPAMFWHDGEAYLIGRRNLTDEGVFDLGFAGLSRGAQAVRYETEYSRLPKRCALWRYVQPEDRIAFVMDLPSRGDTCFAGVLPGARDDERVVYNYSSPLDGPDLPWNQGQLGPTRIYRHVLRFTRR